MSGTLNAQSAVSDYYTSRGHKPKGVEARNGYEFYKTMESFYTGAKQKGLPDALGSYPAQSKRYILGFIGCQLERVCAADLDLSSPDGASQYQQRIAALRHELMSVPRDHTARIRRIFCQLLSYQAPAIQQVKIDPPMECRERLDSPMEGENSTDMETEPMDINTHHTPVAPYALDVDPMDADTSSTPATPSSLDSGTTQMDTEPTTAASSPLNVVPTAMDTDATPAATSSLNVAPTVMNTGFTAAAPSPLSLQPAPEASLNIAMEGIEAAGPSSHITSTAGLSATHVAATGDEAAMQIDNTSAGVVKVTQKSTAAPGSSQNDAQAQEAVERDVDKYRKEREGGMLFTFKQREVIEDDVDNAGRTRLLQQVFSVLKKENDGWTDRHGSLGISDWRLEWWAREMEDEIAKEAEYNFPDPESWMPTGLTDQQVYDIGARRIGAKMQEPLDFYKNTIRRSMKQITFVEDDQPVVFVKSPVERNLPPRPWVLRGSAAFHMGSKRKLNDAFLEREVEHAARDDAIRVRRS